MTIADISQLRYPTVISLVWATLGGAIAWWGGRIKSRIWWTTGSGLMVVAAIKLVFIDFGSLGELGNIIGLIAAGMAFLVVAWLVPIPPKKPCPPSKPPKTDPDDNPDIKEEVHKSSEIQVEEINLNQKIVETDSGISETDSQIQHLDNVVNEQSAQDKPTNISRVFLPVFIIIVFFMAMIWIAIEYTSPSKKSRNYYGIDGFEFGVSPPKVELGIKQPTTPEQKDFIQKKSEANINGDMECTTPPRGSGYPVGSFAVCNGILTAIPHGGFKKKSDINVIDICKQFTDKLPANYVLYAGGEYSGRKLDFQIDQSGHQATQFDVYVNEPGKNVVLALGAYEPSIWNIIWTADTTITGVLISGYHQQEVAGIDNEVPVLNTSYDNKSTCGYFYISRKDPYKADSVIRKLFGQSAHTYYIASGGKLDIGQPVTSSQSWQQNKSHTVASFRNKDTPLAGKAGIEQLINEGKLRPGTPEDLKKWEQLNRRTNSQPSINVVGGNTYEPSEKYQVMQVLGTYVVLAPMRYPAGLYGAHSVTFIISEGVPRPEGNPGHSAVLDMNFGTCSGALCSR
jgi:hypothetical protein